jgi:ComEC/Rec2-related protein
MKKTPSVILASVLAGFILGVFIFSYAFLELAVGLSIAAAVLSFVWAHKKGKVVPLLFVLGLILGAGRLLLAVPSLHSVANDVGEERKIEGIILKREAGEGTQKLTIGNLMIDDQEREDTILVFMNEYPKIELGDRVSVTCLLEKPELFNGFAYDRFLAAKHIYATCYSRRVPSVIQAGAKNGPIIQIRKLHEEAVAFIAKYYGEPHAQLLSGLLFGDDNFSDAWKEKFMRTGTSHVVAASGYNIALVSSLALAFLIYAGVKRQRAFPFVLLAIFAFVILAGGEAAVTRAGIMGALALTATQLGRKSSAKNALLLVTVIMLMIEPRILRDDAGFQLSVLSTLGLIMISKRVSEKLEFVPETFGLRESFASTLVATLFTLPVIIFGFGRISLVGPFTNLIVLAFLPYAMAAGATGIVVTYLLDTFLSIMPSVFLLPGWFFLELILRIIDAMSSLPFAVITL